MRVRPVVMAACSVCDVLRRPGRCRRRALGGCFAAWRWTRVAVDRTGADPDRVCVVIVQRNVRHRAEDPGALDVEDGVPPPRAAPPLLRRVVLNHCLEYLSCTIRGIRFVPQVVLHKIILEHCPPEQHAVHLSSL